ncbi:unnamed protein product [Penicillium salamii]|uniref:Telomeric single stranded DNA binding POT1/Cdc13 domain-containing protein n=1 Tax=Penicillium salamii TaxID=1612424 RepID=A0A9W4NKJ0_9EURO|nr:unnamed protein product [Penicillium salamii]CAG8138765.1 unnamed protein product [Penicillium salamii]CAG8144978.1 unnamed protein product [Penicillium salamii]CAG8160192.1 unnamed protein product [Penicillium salamii]CAG8166614.1 unnamed protein product [Penicillium salamii]
MTAIEQSPAPHAPSSLVRVPIAELCPDLDQPANKSILAAVTLVWPYSSSHKSLSLLLAEPDFRLRRSQGQVKVTFHGRVAETVAESHVGIGDTICLGLNGSEFVRNEATQHTPGKSIAWDAHFKTGVCLEVRQPSQNPFTVNVEHATCAATAAQEAELAPPATPTRKSTSAEHGFVSSMGSWGSPAFLKPSRPSFGGTTRPAFDPFAEDDGFVPGKGRKRPRYSLQRNDWRVVDEPNSPIEQEGAVDWEQALEQELDQEDADADSNPTDDEPERDPTEVSNPEIDVEEQVSQPVFAKPSLELTGSILERRAEESNNAMIQEVRQAQVQLPTDTPKIRPIPSPGLPIPSPLVSDNAGLTDYFPSWTSSEAQEIRSVATEIATPPASFVETSEIEAGSIDYGQAGFAGPDVGSVDQNVFDTIFPPTNETEPYSAPRGLLEEQDSGPINTFSTSITTQSFKVNDQIDDLRGDRPSGSQALYKEDGEEDSIEAMDVFDPMQTDLDVVPVGQATGDLGLADPQSLERAVTDVYGQDLGRNVESVGPDGEHNVGEDSGSDLQSAKDAPSATDLDMDALHALQSMRNLREKESSKRQSSSQEESDGGDEDEDSSLATGVLDRSRDGSPYAGDDQIVDEEDRHNARSEDYYDSEDEYDEEASQYGQDEYGLDESDGDESEQENDSSSRPQPPQSQEVIVLDSDSEDEADSETPGKPNAHSLGQDDRSSSRSGSPGSAVASADADLAIDADLAESQSDGSEKLYGSASEDGSEDNGSEDVNGKGLFHREPDDRVYDSDKGDESSRAVSEQGYDEPDDRVHDSDKDERSPPAVFEQGRDEPTENKAPMQRPNDERGHSFDKFESPDEYQSFGANNANDNDHILEDTADDRDQDLTDTVVYHEDRPERNSQPGTKEHSPKYYNVDGAAESFVAPAADVAEVDAAGLLLGHALTPQVPGSLGTSSFTEPHFEMAADSTQETITYERTVDSEFELSSTINNPQISPDLNLSPQPFPLSGSPKPGEDGAPGSDDHAKKVSETQDDSGNDAESAVEFVQTIETPEPPFAVPKVVISTGSTGSPSALVQPPTPGRDAYGLRSKLSYFPPLATLVDYHNALVDTISIVQAISPASRLKTGTRDWFISIDLTDPSMAGMTLNARISRRYKSAIPALTEGSAILLREFEVQSLEHKITLVSAATSAWAVFDGSGPDAEVNGLPVEYGSEERAYASGLRRWYTEVGSASVADHMLQASIERDSIDREFSPPNSEVPSELGSPSSRRSSRRRRQSNRQVTIHELRDGTRYTEVGSPNSRNSSVHELRDGTLYANI